MTRYTQFRVRLLEACANRAAANAKALYTRVMAYDFVPAEDVVEQFYIIVPVGSHLDVRPEWRRR